tara:strand:- start:28797 stop:29918 length:1122 start_codon:yes stop_codon:yes gene_type:complete
MEIEKMTKNLFTLMMTLAFTFTSCSKLDGMSENATKASENSGRAADAATDSVGILKRSVIVTRPGAAKEARARAMERLKEAVSIEGKVVEAATYFKAFEYQLWLGNHFDTDEYLQTLYEDAMNEIYRNMKELNKDKKISQTNPTAFRINPWRKKRDANLLALSLGLHKVHGLQITVRPIELELEDGSVFSFEDENMGVSALDLIKEALVRIKKYEEGQIAYGELKPYEVVVYENIEEFVTLINVRYNMILTLALAELTNVEESTIEGFSSIILPTSWRSLDSDYMEINDAKKRKANKYITEAAKLRDFMLANGYMNETYAPIEKTFKRMNNPSRSDEDIVILSTNEQSNINEYYQALETIFQVEGNKVIGVKN